jgi:DNA-binding CsgD family transcriptional regulator
MQPDRRMRLDRDTAIDRFFGAALNPEDWPLVLEDIAQALDADGATLIFEPTTRETLIESVHIRDYVSDYFAHGLNFDPREQRVRVGIGDGFVDDARHFTADEVGHDPFYSYLRKHKLGWHAVACLAEAPNPIVLSLKRGARKGPFQPGEIERLDALLPHLRGATAAAQQAWRLALDDQVATLGRLGHHAILLDRQGRASTVSAGFEPGDGLTLRNRVLIAARPADQAMLDRVIAIATSGALPSELPAPPVAPLHRPSGKRPLVARAMPLDRARLSLMASAVAVLLVADMDKVARPAIATIRSVFGLTPREAELALCLGAGQTVNEAADTLGMSVAHARQRLKIVLGKTNTHRQSELVMLVSRLG